MEIESTFSLKIIFGFLISILILFVKCIFNRKKYPSSPPQNDCFISSHFLWCACRSFVYFDCSNVDGVLKIQTVHSIVPNINQIHEYAIGILRKFRLFHSTLLFVCIVFSCFFIRWCINQRFFSGAFLLFSKILFLVFFFFFCLAAGNGDKIHANTKIIRILNFSKKDRIKLWMFYLDEK